MSSLGVCRFCKKNKAITLEAGEGVPICNDCLEDTKEFNSKYLMRLDPDERHELEKWINSHN